MNSVNYSDLHKVYKRHMYNLPPVVENPPPPEPPVIQQVAAPQPESQPEPQVIYYKTREDDPVRDLIGTLGRAYIGWKIMDWLTTSIERPQSINVYKV